jgi:nucleotide-binding universal stress UspA family protein
MFRKILHANDGSDHALRAFRLALELAIQNQAELHMVTVEEIPYLPEFIEEVREEKGAAVGCAWCCNRQGPQPRSAA